MLRTWLLRLIMDSREDLSVRPALQVNSTSEEA
jgi:hypothetical protein